MSIPRYEDRLRQHGRCTTGFRLAATYSAGLIAAIVLFVGCGSEPNTLEVTPTPMGNMADSGRPNAAPSRPLIHFVPPRAAPGERVQAVASVTDRDGDRLTLHYSWSVNGRRLLEDGPNITVPESATNATIEVTVVASDGQEESAPQIARFRVGNRPPRVTQLDVETIEIRGKQGTEPYWQVTATVVDADRNAISVYYEWMVNGRRVEDSTAVFAKQRVARGDEVRVRATPFDGQAHGPMLESAAIVIGNAPPEIVSAPPGLDSSGAFRYQPEVQDGDPGDQFEFRLLEAPETMKIDSSSGLVEWMPTTQDAGSHPVEIEVSDSLGARSRQTFQVSVQVGGQPAPGPASVR